MWIKVHLMCGVKTNVVTSVEISDPYANDYHYFKSLVNKTAQSGFKMLEVSADKAYLGGENLLTTLRHGGIPYILRVTIVAFSQKVRSSSNAISRTQYESVLVPNGSEDGAKMVAVCVDMKPAEAIP